VRVYVAAVAWSESRNTSHDVSGPVIGKSASPAPGVSDCERSSDPPWGATDARATPRSPLRNPLRWVCAHQIITSVRCLPWRPPRYLAAGAINIAVSHSSVIATCPCPCVCAMRWITLFFASLLCSFYFSLSPRHCHMDRVAASELGLMRCLL
jgi:hypothetical protein